MLVIPVRAPESVSGWLLTWSTFTWSREPRHLLVQFIWGGTESPAPVLGGLGPSHPLPQSTQPPRAACSWSPLSPCRARDARAAAGGTASPAQARNVDGGCTASRQAARDSQHQISRVCAQGPGANQAVPANALELPNRPFCFRDHRVRENYKHSFLWILGYFAYLG